MVRGCGTVGLGKLLDGRSGSVLISKLASIGTGFTVAERGPGFGGRSCFLQTNWGHVLWVRACCNLARAWLVFLHMSIAD